MKKPTKIIANIILTGMFSHQMFSYQKTSDQMFSHQIRNKTRVFTVPPLLNNILKGCSQYKKKQKQKASGLERTKLIPTCRWHAMILGLENTSESTPTSLLELIKELSKAAWYEINIKKSIVFL